ncbi:MAG: DUF222 domain-containing protein [Acidimicrobiales bacterium]|jgi:hypothetical protein|nr:DUF222 domain-containing protein [Acidimicrobiales bacterium]
MAVGEATTTPSSPSAGAVSMPSGAARSAALVESLLGAAGAHFGVDDLEWERLDGDGLRAEAEGLQRGISALEHQQRRVLGVIDERRAFTVDGSRDAADWSANNLGISRKAANDRLRLGRDLAELPKLADAAASGSLTADQARPAAELARVAGTDTGWAAQAPHLPVGVLSRHAAKTRRPGAADHRAAQAARHFHTWIDGLEMRFRGSVPTDEGARLLTAIERAMPPRAPHTDANVTPDQRRADGLMALAGATLAGDADPDRATVVAVVELAAICDDDPGATAELETGQPLATETARRLLCDSRIEVVVQDRSGVAVGVGTTSRTVSPGLRRALVHRDGRCRFGNCTATRFLHAHHIAHWPSPTTMGNLTMLCWHHHHLVHEGGWALSGDPNGALLATHPTGASAVESHPRNGRPPDGPPDAPTAGRPDTERRRARAGRSPADPGQPPHRRSTPDPALALFTPDTS